MRDGKLTALDRERIALCDLFQGRILRARAGDCLAVALHLESLGDVPSAVVDVEVARACRYEWVACISEQGIVGWGGRINRCDSRYWFEITEEADSEEAVSHPPSAVSSGSSPVLADPRPPTPDPLPPWPNE